MTKLKKKKLIQLDSDKTKTKKTKKKKALYKMCDRWNVKTIEKLQVIFQRNFLPSSWQKMTPNVTRMKSIYTYFTGQKDTLMGHTKSI